MRVQASDSQRHLALGDEPDFAEMLDARTSQALRQINPPPRRLQVVQAAFALEAGWLAVAVEVIEAVAAVGGAGAFAAQVARRVQRMYGKVAEAVGRKPLISRGTAEWLAIADLNDRQPRELCWRYASGDAGPASPGPGRRGDMFFVVLSTRRELHHYVVSAYGDLSYHGPSPLVEHEMDAPPSYWAGGDTNRD